MPPVPIEIKKRPTMGPTLKNKSKQSANRKKQRQTRTDDQITHIQRTKTKEQYQKPNLLETNIRALTLAEVSNPVRIHTQ